MVFETTTEPFSKVHQLAGPKDRFERDLLYAGEEKPNPPSPIAGGATPRIRIVVSSLCNTSPWTNPCDGDESTQCASHRVRPMSWLGHETGRALGMTL